MPKPNIDFYRFAFEYANEVNTEQLGDTGNRIARALYQSRIDRSISFADAFSKALVMKSELKSEPSSSSEHAKDISKALLRHFSIEDSVKMRHRFDESLKNHIDLFEPTEWNKIYVTAIQVAELRYESQGLTGNDAKHTPWLDLKQDIRVTKAVAVAEERIIVNRMKLI